VKLFLPHQVNVFTDTHSVYYKPVRLHNFHIRTVQLDIIEVFLFTNWRKSDCLKKNNIKIYIKIYIKLNKIGVYVLV